MLIASVDSPVLAIKFSNPFPLSLLNIECVTSIDFFQDGNGKVSDVVVTLTEVMASGLADITVLNVSNMFLHSCPKFPFCFPHILHLATSLETSHNIDHPGSAAVNRSVDVNYSSCN